MEMKSLFEPAKCSCGSACALIVILRVCLLLGRSRGGFTRSLPLPVLTQLLRINRQQIDQRENKHPDQIDEVPLQTADLDIFVVQFVDAAGDDQKINASREDVEHVHAGD